MTRCSTHHTAKSRVSHDTQYNDTKNNSTSKVHIFSSSCAAHVHFPCGKCSRRQGKHGQFSPNSISVPLAPVAQERESYVPLAPHLRHSQPLLILVSKESTIPSQRGELSFSKKEPNTKPNSCSDIGRVIIHDDE